jgi:hypothetical protein
LIFSYQTVMYLNQHKKNQGVKNARNFPVTENVKDVKSDKWVTSLTQFSGQIVKFKVHYRAIKIELSNFIRRSFTSLIYKFDGIE